MKKFKAPDVEWTLRAACIGHWHETFARTFYSNTTRRREKRELSQVEARAKLVCAGCPVRAECLDFALKHHEPAGVWGGLTTYERWKRTRLAEPLERIG